MPAATQKRVQPFLGGPPRTYPDWLDPEETATLTPEEIRASMRALPIHEIPPVLGAPGYDPNITPSGGPVILPSTTEPPMIAGPPVPAPSLAPTGAEVADQYEQGLRIAPTKQPFGFRHPVMAAIGRGFEKAMPIIAGAAEGMAAGAYEPMAGAALGKGFLAAETRPYQKMKLQTDIASRLQDLELKRAHADYYRALAPSVEEKLDIQRHNAESLDFYRKVRARASEYSAQTRRQLADLKTQMQPAEFEALVQKTTLNRALTEQKAQELEANTPAAKVRLWESEIPVHEAQARFYAARAEGTPESMRAQTEATQALTRLRDAQAHAARILASQRSGNNAVDAQTSRALTDVIAGDPNAAERDPSEIASFAADNVARFYKGDAQMEPLRAKVIQHLQGLAQPKGKMTSSQYWTARGRIESNLMGSSLENERNWQLYDLATEAKQGGVQVPSIHLNRPKTTRPGTEQEGGPSKPQGRPANPFR